MLTRDITFNAIKNFLQTTKQRRSKKSPFRETSRYSRTPVQPVQSYSSRGITNGYRPTVCASSSFVQHNRFSQVQPAISTHMALWHQFLSSHSVSPTASKKKKRIVPNEQKKTRLCYRSMTVCVDIYYICTTYSTHTLTLQQRGTRYRETKTVSATAYRRSRLQRSSHRWYRAECFTSCTGITPSARYSLPGAHLE